MKPLKGEVVSTKMNKTAVVLIRKVRVHPLYRKRMTMVKKYSVHDEMGVKAGDQVEFITCRPLSKTKKWRVVKIL